MKKKYISGVMVLALLAFGGCGKQQSYIGADQTKQPESAAAASQQTPAQTA